jgi:hypothetical protein
MRAICLLALIIFYLISPEIKAQIKLEDNKINDVTFEAKLLELINNDIEYLKGDSAEKSNILGQKIYTSKIMFPEFTYSRFIENTMVAVGGELKGEFYSSLTFQTTEANEFLTREIDRLLMKSIPGYTMDNTALEFVANGQDIINGVAFYNQNKSTIVALVESKDHLIRMTIFQYTYFRRQPYDTKKVGFYVGESSNFVIAPLYDAADFFREGLALVNIGGKRLKGRNYYDTDDIKGGKFAFINRNGDIIIPFTECDSAYPFRSGTACFISKGKKTWIDKTGKAINVE